MILILRLKGHKLRGGFELGSVHEKSGALLARKLSGDLFLKVSPHLAKDDAKLATQTLPFSHARLTFASY